MPAWRDYPGGIKAWVEWVLQYDPAAAEGCFVSIPPILRDEHEIEEWKASTVRQELDVRHARELLKGFPDRIPILFPKHTANGNCVRPSECPYLDLCWGVGGDAPLGTGRYQRRVPNHPQEAQHDSTTG